MNKTRIFIAGMFAVLIALFFFLDLGRYLTLESLKANREVLTAYYADHKFVVAGGFIALYILQSALSLPGAAIMSLAGGAIFGVFYGTIYANLGATSGAMVSFLVSRYLFHDAIQNKFGPRLGSINRELETRGINYLLFLRLVPVFPFFLINLGAGLTKLPFRTFFLGTMIGMIPGGFVFCNAGASLATITSISEVASPRVLGSFALLGLFALVPALYQKFKKKA